MPGLTASSHVRCRYLFVLSGDWLVRSHFKHSIELVDDNGEIVGQLAWITGELRWNLGDEVWTAYRGGCQACQKLPIRHAE
jgi:hypothetical protein